MLRDEHTVTLFPHIEAMTKEEEEHAIRLQRKIMKKELDSQIKKERLERRRLEEEILQEEKKLVVKALQEHRAEALERRNMQLKNAQIMQASWKEAIRVKQVEKNGGLMNS